MKTGCLLFCLTAAWALAQDSPVVTIDDDTSRLMGPPAFTEVPPTAVGVVKLKLTVSAWGAVVGAEARSGPEELRRIALNSARVWRFIPTSEKARVVEASVFFGPPPPDLRGRVQRGMVAPPPPRPEPPPADLIVERIVFQHVSEATQQLVLSKINLRVGDKFTPKVHSRVGAEARMVENSLVVTFSYGTTREMATVTISEGWPLDDSTLILQPTTVGKKPRQE